MIVHVKEDRSPQEILELQAKVDGLHERMDKMSKEERVIRVVEKVIETVKHTEEESPKKKKAYKQPKNSLIRV